MFEHFTGNDEVIGTQVLRRGMKDVEARLAVVLRVPIIKLLREASGVVGRVAHAEATNSFENREIGKRHADAEDLGGQHVYDSARAHGGAARVEQLDFSRPKSERGRAFAPPQMLQWKGTGGSTELEDVTNIPPMPVLDGGQGCPGHIGFRSVVLQSGKPGSSSKGCVCETKIVSGRIMISRRREMVAGSGGADVYSSAKMTGTEPLVNRFYSFEDIPVHDEHYLRAGTLQVAAGVGDASVQRIAGPLRTRSR